MWLSKRMTELQNKRSEIRKAAIRERNSLTPEERAEKSAEIADRLVSLPEYRSAGTVMIYRAVKGEVRLEELEKYNMERGGEKTFLYPLCVSESEMVALRPLSENAWKEGYKGITEPVREMSEEFHPESIDLVICPCSSFDEKLGRMGMGAGFYDRFLEKCTNAHVAAVAFECQKADDVLCQEWDRPMEAVITEAKVYRMEKKKHIEVVAAIIEHGGKILSMKRGQSKHAYTSYKYEFPGGKTEAGETRPQALMRELREEMDFVIDIAEDDFFAEVHHEYPDFEISLACYLCHSDTDVFTRKEHNDHVWLEPEKLGTLDWAEADYPVVEKLMNISQF